MTFVLNSLDSPHIHLYVTSTAAWSQLDLCCYKAILSDDELARAHRFKTEPLQAKFVIARAYLRHCLSLVDPSIQPLQWQFEPGEKGKPKVTNAGILPPFFNVSHSKNMVVIALSYHGELGADVEFIERNRHHNLMNIAQHSFHVHEIENLDASQNLEDDFYRIWTLKEAFIKATGKGLSQSLCSFCVYPIQFEGESAAVIHFSPPDNEADASHPWRFCQTKLTDDRPPNHLTNNYMLAIAMQCKTQIPAEVAITELVPSKTNGLDDGQSALFEPEKRAIAPARLTWADTVAESDFSTCPNRMP